VKVYRSIKDFPSEINTIVTIGTFDGVHKGHQVVINRLNYIAKKEGLQSVLLTFHPHPRHVIYPDDQELKLINTIEEKVDLLKYTGLQHLVIHEFSKDFSRINSVNFIRDILVGDLNMKYMVVGFNHHFGKNRQGTFDSLVELSELYDFKIEKIDPQNYGDIIISSTKVRAAINEGDFKKVNSFLGSNFYLKGKVVKGNNIGRKIGFPTANISQDNERKILPKNGVYAVKVWLNNKSYFGMLNIGNRPTILDDNFVIEVHLFDFDLIIYNQELKIEFIQRIRDEIKFSNMKKLKYQLEIDQINCKKILI
tara:strand:+ start:737 stop:1663 length:927 start_codon:yes stop_codon:yes gene_type:complete